MSKRTKRLLAGFGKKPDPLYLAGDLDSIRSYYDYRREQGLDDFLIDEITWNDLDLDRVFRRINPGLSTSGEQYLYYQLRSPAVTEAEYRRRKELIDLVSQEAGLRLKLQQILERLGRTRRADPCAAFVPKAHGGLWLAVYLVLALLVPAAAVYAALGGAQGLLACMYVLVANALLHEYRKRACQRDLDTVNYSVAMVFALQRIRREKHVGLAAHLEEGYAALDRLRPVLRTGGVSTVSDGGVGDLVSTFLLLDLIAYEFLKHKLGRCSGDVFLVHQALGRVDAAIAVASYRESLPCCAVPELDFSGGRAFLSADGMTHPLLDHAVANDLHTRGCALITGSNASGKSTFLRTTALCALLAQSICTVPAQRYRASALRIYSSMALSDDLLAGESYYIVETRSLKRILDALEQGTPLLCTIDEVLRGTNTVERIAASSKILEAMADRGALCLAATHDIELCALLRGRYELYHFEERLGADEMLFDYRLRSGPATSRNAIDLLRLLGFEAKIVSGAHRRANHYLDRGVWQ